MPKMMKYRSSRMETDHSQADSWPKRDGLQPITCNVTKARARMHHKRLTFDKFRTGIRSFLAVVSTIVCSAALSIGLSADSCCLWHDESPTSATPVIRATATTLSLVFILDRIILQSSLPGDARSPS